jgi:hypothetical protein
MTDVDDVHIGIVWVRGRRELPGVTIIIVVLKTVAEWLLPVIYTFVM